MKHLAFVVFSTLLALPAPTSAQGVSGEDPLLGTWHLNVSQSRYRPGPPPESQTRIYKKHRFGIEATVRTVEADGRLVTVQSVFDYDKQEHAVTGSENVDAVVVTRITAFTYVATLSHAGQEIGTLRRVISEDGKKMTVFDLRRAPRLHFTAGGPIEVDNVEIYEKDEH